MNPTKFSNVDLNEITFSEPRPYGTQAKIVYVNHKGRQLVMQTPKLGLPYGLSCYTNEDGVSKYSIDYSLNTEDEKAQQFQQLLENLDDKILNSIVENSKEWLNKAKMSKEVAAALYTSSIKHHMEDGERSGKYPPTFKTKVAYYDNKFARLKVFDSITKEVQEDLESALPKGCKLTGLVKLSGIWLAGGKTGLVFETVQAKADAVTSSDTYAFDDSDDENVVVDTVATEKFTVDSEEDL